MKEILASVRKIKRKKVQKCMAGCFMLSALKLCANKLSASREKQTEKYSQRINTSIFSCWGGGECNLVEIPMRILLLCFVLL